MCDARQIDLVEKSDHQDDVHLPGDHNQIGNANQLNERPDSRASDQACRDLDRCHNSIETNHDCNGDRSPPTDAELTTSKHRRDQTKRVAEQFGENIDISYDGGDNDDWIKQQCHYQHASSAEPVLRSRVKRRKGRWQATVDDRGRVGGRSSSSPSPTKLTAALGVATYGHAVNYPELPQGSRQKLWSGGFDKGNQLISLDKNNNNETTVRPITFLDQSLEDTRDYDEYCHGSKRDIKPLSKASDDSENSPYAKHQPNGFGSPSLLKIIKNLLNRLGVTLYCNLSSSSETSNLDEWQHQQQCSTRIDAPSNSEDSAQQQQLADTEYEASIMSSQADNGDYGTTSGTRYGVLNVAEHQNESKRRSGGSRRSRDPNGYSRLGHTDYEKSTRPTSIFHESKRLLLLLIIVVVSGVILWQIYEALLEEETNYLGVVKSSPSQLGYFDEYAVSTDAKPCALVGKQLLAKGGHVVDAAVGTLICMGVVLPNSLGLGGGCLMTIYDNVTKQATVIDGREQAPEYAHENMFSAAQPLAASRGPLSVGVPGELAAYWEAHKRFGRLEWAELFDASIELAEQGIPTVEHLSQALRDPQHAKHISEPLRKILWNNQTNDYVFEGELLKQPILAQTLRRIRDNGVDEFYRGKTGALFIEDLQKQGGQMTLANLGAYKALVKNATVIELNENLKAYTQPVPGSGLVLGIILRIMHQLGHYQNEKAKQSFDAAALYYHHLAEASKFAYAQRAALEDMPDDPGRMSKLLEEIQSEAFVEKAANKIKKDKTLAIDEYGGLQYFQEDHGTAHVSLVDAQGNCAAVTTSVNLYFGSGLVSPSTGIIYNDVMDDFVSPNITNKFDLAPSRFNRIRPGRRPLSSMAPSVFVNGRGNPELVLGASGGSKITSAIATVALRNLFMNDDIKIAIDGPRIHHQFLPNRISYEANFPAELLGSLVRRGHQVQKIKGRSSVVMAVACEYKGNGSAKVLTANSDYRKGGSVDGL